MSGFVWRDGARDVPNEALLRLMMRARIAVAVFLLAAAVGATSTMAQTGRWTAHTSLRSVRAVAGEGTQIWTATTGGVFGYDTASGEISRFTVVDGLHSVDTRTIQVDGRRSVVWIGYQDGVLDRLEPGSGTIRTYLDIARAQQFSARGINRIVVHGDSLFIATDFGLVVYDPERAEVRDAYTRLGAFSPAASVYDLMVEPSGSVMRLWLATDEGLASAMLDGSNLQDPSSWSNETIGPASAGRPIWSLRQFAGRLYAGTDRDLYVRTDPGLFIPQNVSSFGIRELHVDGDRLVGVETFNVVTVQSDASIRMRSVVGMEAPRSMAIVAGAVWVGDETAGLGEVALSTDGSVFEPVRTVIPDGPAISQFSQLSMSPGGVLWAGGTSEARSGFHRFGADGGWTAYTENTETLLFGRNRYTSIHAAADGSGWAASEGSGLAHVDTDGNLEVFDASNSSLQPAAGTADFVIAGGVATDRKGNVWATTRGASSPLHVMTPDGAWTALPVYVGDGLTTRSTAYGRILVDSFDQKWIILRDENNFNRVRGLLVMDTGSTPTSASDDRFRVFAEKGAAGQGLPGTTVSAVVEDRDGLVWIGTDSGIAYFVNSGVVARDASARAIWPPWADRSEGTFVLFGLKVNDIAVDPANRLWIASDEGAWLINEVEAGYELVHHFTSGNSPLFSDIVESIAVDPVSGQVYFATDRGLVAWQGDAVAPAEETGDLYVYPNPFRPGDVAGPVVISGLVDETDVRIVTPGGVVVASFGARGGQATWDGRDLNGNQAPSGVYLVVAVGANGEGTAYGRVAVIR